MSSPRKPGSDAGSVASGDAAANNVKHAVTKEEFKKSVTQIIGYVRNIVKVATHIGSTKSGEKFRFGDYEIGRADLTKYVSALCTRIELLRKNYDAKGRKTGGKGGRGSSESTPNYVSDAFVAFIRGAKLGPATLNYDGMNHAQLLKYREVVREEYEGEEALQSELSLLLEKNITSRAQLTQLIALQRRLNRDGTRNEFSDAYTPPNEWWLECFGGDTNTRWVFQGTDVTPNTKAEAEAMIGAFAKTSDAAAAAIKSAVVDSKSSGLRRLMAGGLKSYRSEDNKDDHGCWGIGHTAMMGFNGFFVIPDAVIASLDNGAELLDDLKSPDVKAELKRVSAVLKTIRAGHETIEKGHEKALAIHREGMKPEKEKKSKAVGGAGTGRPASGGRRPIGALPSKAARR